MNTLKTLPIKFGSLFVEIFPHFEENSKEKLKYVEVIISCNSEILYRFDLYDQVERVNTLTHGNHSTDIDCEVYLDFSKEKIIFDGIYFEEKNPKGPFWLEIDPNSNYHEILDKIEMPMPECPAYPTSVGTLALSITPPEASTTKSNTSISDIGTLVEIMQVETVVNSTISMTNTSTYLSTTLFPRQKVSGINTYTPNKTHYPDFVGDIGIIRNRVYFDGNLKINEIIYSGFYLEIGFNG